MDRAEEIKQAIDRYLAQGGRIKRYRSRADEIAASVIPRGKYCQRDAYIQKLIEIRAANRKNHLHKNSIATAPSGGIEPRSPSKPWSNPKKIIMRRPVATSAAA